MVLQIENIATVDSGDRLLNYAEITVDDFKFSAPYFSASRKDYDKSDNCRIGLNSQIFQYFVEVTNSKARPLTDNGRQQSIINTFNAYVNTFNPKLSDVTFYSDGNRIDFETRDAILNLQERMPIKFLNDVQLYRDQEMPEFIQQIQSFIDYSSDKIKSPTLSLKMIPELFNQKLDYLLEQNFKRINLEWGGDQSSDENWNAISKASKENEVWFNCVAIIQRRKFSKPFNSNVMRSFYRGVHTCALATLAPKVDVRSFNKKMWMFDNTTDCYNRIYDGTPDANDINSHNLLFNKMEESHETIVNQTYFGNDT